MQEPMSCTDPPDNILQSSIGSEGISAIINPDGRIDIRITPKLGRTLSRLANDSSNLYETEYTVPSIRGSRRGNVKLNVVVQVVGSRGDVQPFLALGCELRKHGHRVRIATHAAFANFVRQAGLEFYPIGGDPTELMSYMVKNPGLVPSMKSLRAGDIKKKRQMVAEMLEGCWQSCLKDDPVTNVPFVADAIIANPPSFAHVHCAQALGVPVHLMFTMPWSNTKAFPHPLANLLHSRDTEPRTANYLSYSMVDYMTWQGLGDVINKWRRESLDLESITPTAGPSLLQTLKVPFTYCWSPALIRKPADWLSHIDICGFFFRDPPQYTPETELNHFLLSSAGVNIVYIGFGSIVIEEPTKMTQLLVQAVRAANVRAIISRGWSKLGGIDDPNVLYLDDCPHEWLFQRVAAVVHHGGAGTTACGLVNGKPTTIVPFFGDQQFWGKMVAAAGAGPSPIPHKSLNAENLADAITFCLKHDVREAALELASRMRSENGVEAAVDSFLTNLPLDSMRCEVLPDQPAVWKSKMGNKSLRLSKVAASALTTKGHIERRTFQLYQTKPIVIDNRRLDPVSAVISASISTVMHMGSATSGIFVKPYKVYRNSHRNLLSSPHDTSATNWSVLHQSDSCESDACQAKTPRYSETSTIHPESHSCAKSMASASSKSLGMIFGSAAQGLFVDIPLAAAEGLSAISAIYSAEPISKQGIPVTDWKTGVTVAGKKFVSGMHEGLTDIIILPYRGKKDQGAWGVTKGLSKGLVSLSAKTGSAVFGLVAYSGQGVSRSLRGIIRPGIRRDIEKAKEKEGLWLSANAAASQNKDTDWSGQVEAFLKRNHMER